MDTNTFIRLALAEDLATGGDHSTLASIPPTVSGKAALKIKEDGILAGTELAKSIFRQVEAEVVYNEFKQDGDHISYGETAFEVTAKVHTILTAERLVLNCMQRMSGIASLTHTYVLKI